MPYRVRQHRTGEGGFTLIELLVVILIIGILAAIAIPAFLNQKSKATDSVAKVQARTAEIAAETYATDHNGEYKEMTVAELQGIDTALTDTSKATLTLVEPKFGNKPGQIDLQHRRDVLSRTSGRWRGLSHLHARQRIQPRRLSGLKRMVGIAVRWRRSSAARRAPIISSWRSSPLRESSARSSARS
jgi:prepilin-type N-terminal cleavage/methylation domain-containing protein